MSNATGYTGDYNDSYDDEDESIVISGSDIEKGKIIINMGCYKRPKKSSGINSSLDINVGGLIDEEFVFRDIDDKAVVSTIDVIYNKVISNLKFLDFINYEYNKNYCNEINSFLKDSKAKVERNYIKSNKFSSAEFVLTSSVNFFRGGAILNIDIWDILEGEIVSSVKFPLNINKDNSTTANKISDLIFKAYTGENIGMFDSRIIYLLESGKATERDKQVAIMNFDGSNQKLITTGKDIKLSPMFSRENKDEIYYTKGNRKDGFFVHNLNLKTKKITRIAFNNILMTTASAFSPKGSSIILAGTDDDANTNLFAYNMDEDLSEQLTFSKGISTSPSYNPNGTKIVFVSDETGSRKLYSLNLKSKRKRQITTGNGTYDKPAWSPDGKLIAFVKISKNKFLLGLISEYGEGERYLLSDYFIDGISWSPNSRYLIYTKQTSAYGEGSIPKLYIMDIVTGKEIKLNTPVGKGASYADWIIND